VGLWLYLFDPGSQRGAAVGLSARYQENQGHRRVFDEQVRNLCQDALPEHNPTLDYLTEAAPAVFHSAEVALQRFMQAEVVLQEFVPNLIAIAQGDIVTEPTHLVTDMQEFALFGQPHLL
jgi:hypothetical protein